MAFLRNCVVIFLSALCLLSSESFSIAITYKLLLALALSVPDSPRPGQIAQYFIKRFAASPRFFRPFITVFLSGKATT